MRIAILGATSEIAKDLILSFAKNSTHSLSLFARRPQVVSEWLASVQLQNKYEQHSFEHLQNSDHYDAIINFVGVGNPAKTAALGAGIFEITAMHDDLALRYLEAHPNCKYLFLSSGAAYCSDFAEPVDERTRTNLDINHIQSQDWYGIAKLHAECRHRALSHLSIVDIRVFNYFSHKQDMSARFLMADIIRSLKNKSIFETSSIDIVRDYIDPSDFYRLITLILGSPAHNTSVDCYSKSPISKLELLALMHHNFGLVYKISNTTQGLEVTGQKLNYFSKYQKADEAFKYKPQYSSKKTLLEQVQLSLCY